MKTEQSDVRNPEHLYGVYRLTVNMVELQAHNLQAHSSWWNCTGGFLEKSTGITFEISFKKATTVEGD